MLPFKDGKRSVFDALTQVITIIIVGKDLSGLDQEAGGHRIQRVPPTERKGRVHTSSVTVAVSDPTVKTFDNKLMMRSDDDFRVEWYSGTGNGGQHRNRHMNSCRLIHIPTNTVEQRQGRQRESNLSQAKDAIIKRLDAMAYDQNKVFNDHARKQQIGSGMRGDKMRTYRFQDDIVKDHMTDKQASCTKVMRGYFNLLWK